MIGTYIAYKLIDTCINVFFNDLEAKLVPLDSFYTDAMMIHDIKWVITTCNLKFIDVGDRSLTIKMMATVSGTRRKYPVSYHTHINDRMYDFLSNQVKCGKKEFHGARLLVATWGRKEIGGGVIGLTMNYKYPAQSEKPQIGFDLDDRGRILNFDETKFGIKKMIE